MVGLFWMVDIGLAIVSAVLAGIVLTIYMQSRRKIRSRVLLWPASIAAIFLGGNIVAAYYYYILALSFGAAVAIPLMIIQAFQLVGYSLLLVVSLR